MALVQNQIRASDPAGSIFTVQADDADPNTPAVCIAATQNGSDLSLAEAKAAYASLLAQWAMKSQAMDLILAGLPAAMLTPALDSDGSPLGGFMVKPENFPVWAYAAAHTWRCTIPGIDADSLAVIAAAVTQQFGDAVTLAGA